MKALNHPPVKIGKIVEPKGLRGAVKVVVFSRERPAWLKQLKRVWLQSTDESPLRSVVCHSAKYENSYLLLELAEVKDRTQAEMLKGQAVYVEAELFESKPGENIFLREILGFEVVDATLGNLGKVIGFDTNTAQDLLIVQPENAEQEILVPLIKDFLIKIDAAAKVIEMNLPEGLVQANEK